MTEKNKTETLIKCAFYGTLRRNQNNYQWLFDMYGTSGVQYKKTVSVRGFKMYNLGYYPGVIEGGHDDEIVVDLMELIPEAYNVVYNMELGAGYREDTVSIDDRLYNIFIYDENINPNWGIVKNGDWVITNYNKRTKHQEY